MLAFRQGFPGELAKAEQYVGRFDRRKGHAFSDAVLEFVYGILAPHPLAFPASSHPLLPGRPLRRAVFQRRYVLLYELRPDDVVAMVDFHHTGSDVSQRPLSPDEDE